MPMPPVINPYDPRKKQQQPAQQQPVQQPGQQQPAQPSQAVQSSLPPMQQPQQAPVQQQKKPAAPVTYQQQAGAVADPRFSQALAQKLQSDVAAKTAALQQQQAQFQEELNKASGGVPAQERISGLLGKITSGQASEAELSEYDKLQKMQYQGPTGLQGTANIAALSQLAGSPQLLAQQYAGFAPGGVRPGDFARAMAGLQKSPELASAQQAATGLAERAMSAEEIAAQQAGLLKGQTEAAKTQAETAVKAEQEKYMAGLGEEAKGQIEAKKSALDKLKAGLFMGQKISQADLQKLGLSKEDLQNLKGINVSQVEGIGQIKSVEDLDKAVTALKKKQTESGKAESVLTPEQDRLINIFDSIGDVGRDVDAAIGTAYAKKEDLNKINALRRLSGKSPLTEDEVSQLGTGAASGGISQERLSSLKGLLKSGEDAYNTEANQTIADKQDRLTGNKWYKGGLAKAYEDSKKINYNTNNMGELDKMKTLADTILGQMSKTGAVKNDLYRWLKENANKMRGTTTPDAKNKKYTSEFVKLLKQNKQALEKDISGRSDISKKLDIE